MHFTIFFLFLNMQKTVLLFFLAAVFFLGSCGGKEGPDTPGEKTPEQIAIESLTGGSSMIWTVANGGSVTKDAQNVTSDYAGFELRLITGASNKTYTSTPNSLFDQNGSWSFAGQNFDKIQMTGTQPAAGKEISFSRTDEKLILNFTVPLPSNARVTALAGSYIFELVKK